MKFFNAVVLALAQAQDFEEKGLSLQKKVDNVMSKCYTFMEKSMTCQPPSGKLGKYQYRISKLVNDAVWHYNEGKCDPRSAGYGYRKRRQADLDAEFDAIMAEIEDNDFDGKGYGYPSTPLKYLNKLEAVCEKSFKALYNAPELQDCPKLGAWENRSEELLADLTAMKKVCANGKGKDQQPY
ncbi:Oidioi.mRNA.OKI2018_I69.chr1.g2371.t1.cds [Oikopleura dioica]|uniref:Oidioi.mRNA.OKI2018_I69.chr1.g2371.t1.cds n=1 Tax=Oikopleura dioica TaxID=34765 RepID=A0ABN7SUT8_OIKDI|nr:Oidioi.mRNA.OKI2018_I69.chr1.g2371.t1.cds [Oikopleura dioica]